MYKIIGYYICEPIEIPQYLVRTGKMVSVSGCFGGTHPRLETCFFANDYVTSKESEEYRKFWNISDEKQEKLTKEIGNLLGKRLEVDGRFTHFLDARRFYEEYFSKGNCIIVSLSTTERYFDILKGELTGGNCAIISDGTDCAEEDGPEDKLLGFDILGWDIGNFHSFLCNDLQKMLPTARFNRYGLLENTFDETSAFADHIQGQGEPVLWIPCRIGKCI